MSVPAITIRYESAYKTLTVEGSFGAGDSAVSVVLIPAITGTQVISLKLAGTDLAQDSITDGAGTIDLSTSSLATLFSGTPLNHSVSVDISVSDSSAGLLGNGSVVLENTADGFSVLRVAGAGQIAGVLAESLSAGTPFRRTAAGLFAGCTAEDAADYLGILKTGGDAGASADGITAGIVQIPDWGLAPGFAYYLTHGLTELTANAPSGYNVRLVGIAWDADTLLLLDTMTVETATGDFLTYDVTSRRLRMVAAVEFGGDILDAGKMVKLDSRGKLQPSVIPDISGTALSAVRDVFEGVAELVNPTGAEKTDRINLLLTKLQGLGL